MCRMVFYHNKAAAGAVPDVAQVFDSNNFYSGRNVNYATKFNFLDDITHQMVITSYNSSSGVAFTQVPRCSRSLGSLLELWYSMEETLAQSRICRLTTSESPTVVTTSLVAP